MEGPLQYAAHMGRHFHASVGSGAAVKELCRKSTMGSSIRGSPSCSFGARLKFAWLQWFAAPAPAYAYPGYPHAQGVDMCTPFTDTRCAVNCSFAHCLASFFTGSTRDSVLVVRGGLQYALFATAAFARTLNAAPLQQWAEVMRRELREMLVLLDRVFPGRVVWVLLSPFSTLASCRPPLSEVGGLVPAVNGVLREVLGGTNQTVVDPTEFHRAWTGVSTKDRTDGQGYMDCIHFEVEASEAPMKDATVGAILQAAGLQPTSHRLASPAVTVAAQREATTPERVHVGFRSL